MWEMQEQRLNTWAEMQAMSRLCGSVAKVHENMLQMGALPSLAACRFHYFTVQLTAHLLFFVPLNHVSLAILSFLTMTVLLWVR
jgi:hypothetical protein